VNGWPRSFYEQDPLIGTVVTSPDPALAESLTRAFDFLWIDLEHGALSVRDAQVLMMATQSAGKLTFVRVPTWHSEHLPAVLDTGVDGVVAPMVETAEEALAFVGRCRFPPLGARGYGPRRAGGYGRTPRFWAAPEADVIRIVQIETPTAVEQAPAIAAVEGVDAVVVGSSDLSLSLGSPQELRSPAMRSAIERVQAAAADAEIGFGLAAGGEPSVIGELVSSRGRSSFVVYSVDLRMYAAAADGAAAAMKKGFSGTRGGGKRHVSA